MKYTNPVEEEVITKLDEGKEEAPKKWRVTNLPNKAEDVEFASLSCARDFAANYKKEHNLSNPVVERI